MDIDVDEVNDLLLDVSQAFAWRRGYSCPCRSDASGQAALGCPQCGGKGTSWGPPVDAWAAVAGMRVSRQWAAFGQWEDGDMVMSVPSDSPFYACGEKDRVLMAQASEPFSKVLVRGKTDTIGFTTESLERVYWLSKDLRTVIEGTVPAVTVDGTFSFDGLDVVPEPGQQYSVTGRKRPEYFIYQDMPQDRAHFRGLKLPRRVVLRKLDLFGRVGVGTSF